MQFEPPMQNHRFDHYRTMNSDRFMFPEELFSVNSTNSFQSDHTAHIAIPIILREAEPRQPLSSPTYRPTSRDIICGRGRGSFLHEGNKVYLALLRKNINAYMAARKRNQKSNIISRIVSTLKESGFRFLKQEENKQGWYELTKTECYERTAHAIRDLIRKQKGGRKAKKSGSKSSTPIDSDSSVSTEATETKPIKHSSEGLKIDIPVLPEQVFTSSAKSPHSVEINANDDVDSFDEQIHQLPSEVMSPTDTLKTEGAFDVFFEITEDDFETILAQLDTDQQSGGGH